MKLSKKGQIKIGESLCIFGRSLAGSRATALAQLAFEPDDFEGVVVLTVEEAKEFLKQIDRSIDPADKPYSYSKVRLSILNQLEQAEKENER